VNQHAFLKWGKRVKGGRGFSQVGSTPTEHTGNVRMQEVDYRQVPKRPKNSDFGSWCLRPRREETKVGLTSPGDSAVIKKKGLSRAESHPSKEWWRCGGAPERDCGRWGCQKKKSRDWKTGASIETQPKGKKTFNKEAYKIPLPHTPRSILQSLYIRPCPRGERIGPDYRGLPVPERCHKPTPAARRKESSTNQKHEFGWNSDVEKQMKKGSRHSRASPQTAQGGQGPDPGRGKEVTGGFEIRTN